MVDKQPQPLCVAPAEESLDQCLKNQQNNVCRNSMEPDISPRLQNVDNRIDKMSNVRPGLFRLPDSHQSWLIKNWPNELKTMERRVLMKEDVSKNNNQNSAS
ncbi:hypothetical protein HAX54_021258 [Datura stramonium]|uniref:Uncharacterized protein n=1 Tax=Datura stramonium TaxID=4076 RepID=A0ABS8S3Z0_DATST|nr:hypothetical protein [Datura stramonium]